LAECAAGGPKIDLEAMVREVNKAAKEAANCAGPGEPSGYGDIRLIFTCDGRVTKAELVVGEATLPSPGMGAEFLGTPVQRCVEDAFQKVQLPPFGGRNISVSKIFRVDSARHRGPPF
jgi:hypothetical protein